MATTAAAITLPKRRTLATTSAAHALHDGYTDLLYVLLPIWQAQFGLGYAEVGGLRALYVGAMAGLQLPAGLLAERIGGKATLAAGTAVAAAGFLVAGVGGGFGALIAALLLAGVGASVQHPIGSSLVARAYEGNARAALGTYNFAGDVGKVVLPAATAWLVAVAPWQSAMLVLAALGLGGAAAILALLPVPPHRAHHAATTADAPAAHAAPRHGFPTLMAIGVIDSATRMGFLTFLPFLLTAKGAGLPEIGVALALVFAGGAAGKLVCGWLGERLGVLPCVLATESLTALGIVALLPLPLEACYVVLPMVGVALNGTSSVLYGTVPELVAPQRRERAFALFYTGTVGGGAVSPVVYGAFSDALGVPAMMALIAAIALVTLPLAWALRSALPEARGA
jgi:MFS family permease